METREINASYKWRLTIAAKNKNGKTFTEHIEKVVGPDFYTAKIHLNVRLQKKQWTLLAITKAVPIGINFAFYKDTYEDVPRDKYAEIPLPEIPIEL